MSEEYVDIIVEERTIVYLLTMSICPNLKGFYFLLEGIKIVCRNLGKSRNINNILYKEIARKFNIDKKMIDSAMRHAIKVGFNKKGITEFEKQYNVSFKNPKPTPKEIFSRVALLLKNDEVLIRCKSERIN